MRSFSGADYGYRRLQEIGNGCSFAHELRIHADTEIPAQLFARCPFECRHHDGFCGSGQNRAAHDYKMKRILCFQNVANVLADRLNMPQVEFAVPQTGRSNTKK